MQTRDGEGWEKVHNLDDLQEMPEGTGISGEEGAPADYSVWKLRSACWNLELTREVPAILCFSLEEAVYRIPLSGREARDYVPIPVQSQFLSKVTLPQY